MRALAVLVLAPAFALGVVAGAVGLVGGGVTVAQRPDSLVWANRVFTSRQSLSLWLEGRGASYETFVQRHPSAARVFGDGAEPRTLATSSSAIDDRAKRGAQHRDALLVGLLAAGSLALLLAIYARLGRTAGYSRPPAHRQRTPRVQVHTKLHVPHMRGLPAWAPPRIRLLAIAAPAAHGRGPLFVDVRSGLIWIRLRRILPRIAFYAIAALVAVALGASVAIYLQ